MLGRSIVVFALLMVGFPVIGKGQGSLSLDLSEFKGASSCIGVALYREEGFLIEKEALYSDYLCKGDEAHTRYYKILDSIPIGKYALAVFEDLNQNKKLDKNLTGIPTEPYVFSNHAGSKWSKPSFDDASFELVAGSNHLTLTLKYWKDY
jgi:uncharacterized protein (DUF2141 family)